MRADEWEALRDVRLRALADAPRAFSTTLAEAETRAEQDWRDAATRGAAGDRWATFVADDGGTFVGMASGYLPGESHETPLAYLMQMWVDPSRRRQGIGAGLIAEVLGWARSRGAARIRLDVVIGELPAIRLYERVGFRDTGRRARVRDDRDDVEMEMERLTGDG